MRRLTTIAVLAAAACACPKPRNLHLDLVRLAIHQAEQRSDYPTQDQVIEELASIVCNIKRVELQQQPDAEECTDDAHYLMSRHYKVAQ